MKRVSEVLAQHGELDGSVKIEDLVGMDFIIHNFTLIDTKWGPCARVEISIAKKDEVLLTWSKVIISQLEQLEGDLPLVATIQRVKRYYTLA